MWVTVRLACLKKKVIKNSNCKYCFCRGFTVLSVSACLFRQDLSFHCLLQAPQIFPHVALLQSLVSSNICTENLTLMWQTRTTSLIKRLRCWRATSILRSFTAISLIFLPTIDMFFTFTGDADILRNVKNEESGQTIIHCTPATGKSYVL